jgi:hypothetical protein
MDCREGKEWNFSYVLPQPAGQPVCLVVPTLLQMGWVKLPPYFCLATETARDTATAYIETGIGTRPCHKFEQYATGSLDYNKLPAIARGDSILRYLLEVYINGFISIVIPTSQAQLRHVANAILEGIHDVFPPDSYTIMTQFQKRNSSRMKAGTRYSRLYWVLILMVTQK